MRVRSATRSTLSKETFLELFRNFTFSGKVTTLVILRVCLRSMFEYDNINRVFIIVFLRGVWLVSRAVAAAAVDGGIGGGAVQYRQTGSAAIEVHASARSPMSTVNSSSVRRPIPAARPD